MVVFRSDNRIQQTSVPTQWYEYALTFKYAIVSRGSNVNGTRYSRAGCAALNTSELTVAVNKPRK